MTIRLRNRFLSLTTACLLVACVQDSPSPASNADPEGTTQAAEIVSTTALAIEQAERMLDRGEDAAAAREHLLAALDDPQITVEEREAAALALSRAHEVLGDEEQAIAVIESEMSRHDHTHDGVTRAIRERLRELLTGSTERKGLEPRREQVTKSFTRYLTRFFPANDGGRVNVEMHIFGGDSDVSLKLGTYDVAAGVRAEAEERCPLCTHDLNIGVSRARGDWTNIPASEADFDDALVVFYFDLDRNRIPARYERHLPMKVAEIEARLQDGESFIVGTERPGQPPIILIAAPRAAQLDDAEAHLGDLEELPLEPLQLNLDNDLRPGEIQAVIRSGYFSTVRSCYEGLLQSDPQAEGKLRLRMTITEGRVQDPVIDIERGNLNNSAFLTCLLDGFDDVRFPNTAGSTKVTYPIVVSPE